MIQLHTASPLPTIWYTALGEAIPVRELTNRHIFNILAFFNIDTYRNPERQAMVNAVYEEALRRGLRAIDR